MSVMIPDMKIIQRLEEPPLLSFRGHDWGGNAIRLSQFTCGGYTLFGLEPDPVWVHMAEPNDWVVVPFEPVAPLQAAVERLQIGYRVVLRKSGEPVPLLKAVFSQKVELTYDQLALLARHLGLQRKRSRPELLRDIARFVDGDAQAVESLDSVPDLPYKVSLDLIASIHSCPLGLGYALRYADYY